MKHFNIALTTCLLLAGTTTSGVSVIWNSLSGAGDSINQNVQINSDTAINTGTGSSIVANSRDIDISLLQDVTVYGNNTPQSVLLLEVYYPYTIRIHVTRNLTLAGSIGNVPLLVNHVGDGTIEWIIEDDATLTFGNNEEDRGGVTFQIICNENTMPNVIFKTRRTDKRAAIIFSKKSNINYVFNPNNFTYKAEIPVGSTVIPFMKIETSSAPKDETVNAHCINFKDNSGLFFELNQD